MKFLATGTSARFHQATTCSQELKVVHPQRPALPSLSMEARRPTPNADLVTASLCSWEALPGWSVSSPLSWTFSQRSLGSPPFSVTLLLSVPAGSSLMSVCVALFSLSPLTI